MLWFAEAGSCVQKRIHGGVELGSGSRDDKQFLPHAAVGQ